MGKSPSIKLYYATTGKWIGDKNLTTIIDSGMKDLKQLDLFHDVKFIPYKHLLVVRFPSR